MRYDIATDNFLNLFYEELDRTDSLFNYSLWVCYKKTLLSDKDITQKQFETWKVPKTKKSLFMAGYIKMNKIKRLAGVNINIDYNEDGIQKREVKVSFNSVKRVNNLIAKEIERCEQELFKFDYKIREDKEATKEEVQNILDSSRLLNKEINALMMCGR